MNAKMNRKTKTQEEARLAHNEYMRKWRSQNRERIKEQDRERARRKALAEMESVKQLAAGVAIVRCFDGGEFIVGRRNR